MLVKVFSAVVNGNEAYPVEVEVGYGDAIMVIAVNIYRNFFEPVALGTSPVGLSDCPCSPA